MRRRSAGLTSALIFAIVPVVAALVAAASVPQDRVPDWPEVTKQTKPWTRWWWLGSAVDAAGLTGELEAMRAVGLGGVEITPIYGVAGAESEFIPYLSDAWVRILEHTLRTAADLDLGVDMATGTGWPFGGPWVTDRDACRSLASRTWRLAGGERLSEPIRLEQSPLVRAIGSQIYEVLDTAPGETAAQGSRTQPLTRPAAAKLQIADLEEPVTANPDLQALALEQVRYPKPLPLAALIAYSDAGDIADLTARVRPDGTLDWVAPAGDWTIYGAFLGWHGKLVERAAPGGEGDVIDHFSRDAIRRYLARFDAAFTGRPLPGLRAFFNDSYEVDDATGQADGTAGLFDEFQRRRGYDLRRHLPVLFTPDGSDRSTRVRADYRETLSDLLLETFTSEWSAWARERGALVRNQAHGSPANVLDLYAASDIPETEGTEIARAKWASSAAHVAGRRLVAAEAATWLGEHFRATLADVRAALDLFFVSGVNHIVYHGTAYSPAQAAWPGYLFYASVEFNSRNPWWSDFTALNAYVTRVQSFLQSGEADHDVLVYYPFYESLTVPGKERLRHFGTANPPPERTTFETASQVLQQRGYTYDYISDRQLADVRVSDGNLVTRGGASYRTLVMPAAAYVPVETVERILALSRSGATVLAFKGLPTDASGYANLDQQRARLKAVTGSLGFGSPGPDGVREARVGRGRLLQGMDLDGLLARARVTREPLVDLGLQFARRRFEGGRCYFIANPGSRDVDDWIPLDDRSPRATVFDPMSGRRGAAEVRRSSAGQLEVRLALPRSSSVIVVTGAAAPAGRFAAFDPAGDAVEIGGPWTVRFVSGGPDLPPQRSVDRLMSWTRLGGEEVVKFSGTAAYSTTFSPVENVAAWELDLGEVHSSARVLVNGQEVGTLIGPTFRMVIDSDRLSRPSNVLEVQVTNLMANRIAALDRAGVRWRRFYNVNFPARLAENRGPDGLFTAIKWEPLESGLIGPVTMKPLSPR